MINTAMNNNALNGDFTTLYISLEEYTSAANKLAALEAEFQTAITELIAECFRQDFAELQTELSELESRIETLAIRHPEWFVKSKTLKTPFGSVASRSTTKLDIPCEEATIALLEVRGDEGKPFLRERKYLSVEALEALDDGELRRLKVNRVTTEKVTISPAKVDLGKAVKAAKAGKEEAPA